jgi:hypothetical protein
VRAAGPLTALTLALGLALPATASAALPPDFFGIYSEDAFQLRDSNRRVTLDQQREAGIGVVRLPLDWATIQPDPDRWMFGRHDEFVLDAARAGMRVLPFLIQTPGWATSKPPDSDATGIWPPMFPDYIQEFATEAVRRYGPGGSLWQGHPEVPYLPIRSWQIWNEPNLRQFWASGPDPAAYTRLVESAARGIRSVDPAAEIVSAGLPDTETTHIAAPTFLAGMYDAGARGLVDAVGVHPYAWSAEENVGKVEQILQVMHRYGDDAPVWATEFGWATGGPSGWVTSEENQARLIAGAVRRLASERKRLRLRGVAIYNWRDSEGPGWPAHAGLRRLDNSPKPAYFALRDAIHGFGIETTVAGSTDPATDAASPAPATATPWKLRLSAPRLLRPAGRRQVRIAVKCGSTAKVFCAGSVWLEARRARGGRRRRLGSEGFRARSGRADRVDVRLAPDAVRLLRRRGRVAIVVRGGGTDLFGRAAETSLSRKLDAGSLRPRG